MTLQEVIATGLENNYSIRIARKQEQVSINNFTRGNAGFLPSSTCVPATVAATGPPTGLISTEPKAP